MRDRRDSEPLPGRWLNCPSFSNQLIADKFIAFKTPLSRHFNSQIPAESRFTPCTLFDSSKNNKWRIGLWIDLTNTNRYYARQDVINGYKDERQISYVKMRCSGFGETPTREQTDLFISICQRFIQQNPDEVIGVHCTHGFNRTGFLIVSYLVQEMKWALNDAVKEFAKCREPGIYKSDYLEELYSRYSTQPGLKPSLPPRPTWCNEIIG